MSGSWTSHPRAVAPIAISIVLEILALLAVGLRFYSHRLKRVSTRSHDIAILVAMLFSSGLVVCLIALTVMGGLGQHIDELSNPTVQLVNFGKIYYAISPIWGVAISFVKISILLLYISIFRRDSFIKLCYVLIVLQGLWCIATILASMLLCIPIKMNWDVTATGTCDSKVGTYLGLHITNLIFDLIVGLCPIPVLWSLQLKTARKIELSCIFALGIAICIITICRIAMVKDIEGTDLTYATSPLCTFMLLETLLGIILACLPTMRPAIEQLSSFISVPSSLQRLQGDSGVASSSADSRKTGTNNGNSSYTDLEPLKGRITTTNHYVVTSEDVSLEWMGQNQRRNGNSAHVLE